MSSTPIMETAEGVEVGHHGGSRSSMGFTMKAAILLYILTACCSLWILHHKHEGWNSAVTEVSKQLSEFGRLNIKPRPPKLVSGGVSAEGGWAPGALRWHGGGGRLGTRARSLLAGALGGGGREEEEEEAGGGGGAAVHPALVQVPRWVSRPGLGTGLVAAECGGGGGGGGAGPAAAALLLCAGGGQGDDAFLNFGETDDEDLYTDSSGYEDSSSNGFSVAIVHLFHRHSADSIAVLDQAVEVAMHDCTRVELLVIDDASLHKDEAQALRATVEGYVRRAKGGALAARVHRNPHRPWGLTASLDLALKMVHSELVLVLGKGIKLQPGCIKAMASTFYSHPNVGAVTPLIMEPNLLDPLGAGGYIGEDGDLLSLVEQEPLGLEDSEHALLSGNGLIFYDHNLNYVREADFAPWACALLGRSAVTSVGGPDPAYAHRGDVRADADLGFALRHAGYRILFQPAAVAVAEVELFKKEPPNHRAKDWFENKWMSAMKARLKHSPPKSAAMEASYILSNHYAFRFLFYCFGSKDLGAPGVVMFFQLLHAARIHVTVVTQGDVPHQFGETLRYIGIQVIPLEIFEQLDEEQIVGFNWVWAHGPCRRTAAGGAGRYCSALPYLLTPPGINANGERSGLINDTNHGLLMVGSLIDDSNDFDSNTELESNLKTPSCQTMHLATETGALVLLSPGPDLIEATAHQAAEVLRAAAAAAPSLHSWHRALTLRTVPNSL